MWEGAEGFVDGLCPACGGVGSACRGEEGDGAVDNEEEGVSRIVWKVGGFSVGALENVGPPVVWGSMLV